MGYIGQDLNTDIQVNKYEYIVGTPKENYDGSTTIFPCTYDRQVDVLVRGIRFPKAGYTYGDGTYITMVTPLDVGTTVMLDAFYDISYVDLYDKPQIDAFNAAQDVEIALKADTTYVNAKPTGKKNLLINGDQRHNQRGLSGGLNQVILNTRNDGGSHVISWGYTAEDVTVTTAVYATTDTVKDTSTDKYYKCILVNTVGILLTNVTYFTEITVTISEATTLGASDALTTWDTPLTTNAGYGTVVTLTENKYIKVEFSVSGFRKAQFEQGIVPTNYAIIEDTLDECLYYFEIIGGAFSGYSSVASQNKRHSISVVKKVKPFTVSRKDIKENSNISSEGAISGTSELTYFTFLILILSASNYVWHATYTVNAEIFNADDGVGINYKEDRWYV